jgi:hypothetical protein
VVRVQLSTKLPITAEEAAALVAIPALLNHIAAPLLRFVALDPPALPDVWGERRYHVRVLLGGLLPLGRQWIDISRHSGPAGGFRMRDNGSGDLARRWDHWITITPDAAGGCTYTDDVEIEAGLLTPFVWSFAKLFYAHRQRRWRVLAAKVSAGALELAQRTAWRARLDEELGAYRAARERGDAPGQWYSLERAHILSQIELGPHLQVHRLMLGLAIRLGDGREIIGQAVRLALAPLGSLSGRIPWGNTGRSTVSAFTPMPIPADLRDVLPPTTVEPPSPV